MKWNDIDPVEINEAFASVAIAWLKETASRTSKLTLMAARLLWAFDRRNWRKTDGNVAA